MENGVPKDIAEPKKVNAKKGVLTKNGKYSN